MRINFRFIIILSFVFIVASVMLAWMRFDHPQATRVIFLDVGQGDAALIITPGRKTVLIDAGPDASVIKKLGQYLPPWQRSLDYVINSHPQADHLTGLLSVLDRYRVGQVVTTGVVHTTDEYLSWLSKIKEKKIPVLIAQAGLTINLEPGIHLKILSPTQRLAGQRVADLNVTSIVSRLEVGQMRFLFTGDFPAGEEERLVAAGVDVQAQVLKVSHHGSVSSSTSEFVQAVSPTFAIISVGRDNSFGHPSQVVIKRLLRLGANVSRTDRDGDIILESDGKKIWKK